MTPSVLLSGARGFIGRRLRAALIESGYRVYVVDDVLKVKKPPVNLACVIHLAAVSNQSDFSKDILASYKVNVVGTLNLLSLAAKNGCPFLFASTSAVYGFPRKEKVNEREPVRPISPYGMSKWMGEEFCRDASAGCKIPITVLRLFNIFGPGQSEKFLIPSLVNKGLNGRLLEIKHPNFKRDFLYIDDLVNLILMAVQKPGSGCRVFNVGSGRALSVQAVIEEIEKLSGKKIRWMKSKGRAGPEVSCLYADISSVRKELGWKPRVHFKAGLKSVLDSHL